MNPAPKQVKVLFSEMVVAAVTDYFSHKRVVQVPKPKLVADFMCH